MRERFFSWSRRSFEMYTTTVDLLKKKRRKYLVDINEKLFVFSTRLPYVNLLVLHIFVQWNKHRMLEESTLLR